MQDIQSDLFKLITNSNLSSFNQRLLFEMAGNLQEADVELFIEKAKSRPEFLVELSNSIHKKIIYLQEDGDLSQIIKSGEKISQILTEK